MISFIVPAHNEQACIGRTLQAIHVSARAVGQPCEIIVVNDASTDATAEIAQKQEARVVAVTHRKIAATRNSGGRAARGERLFFVDADTTINSRVVASALRAMEQGAVGGGAAARFDDGCIPSYAKLISGLAVPISWLLGFTGGAFMFCTREAFQATGGFSERLYWGEEGSFALALKREGRFVVLCQSVRTSGRRFRKISGVQLVAGGIRLAFSPIKMFTQRSIVEKVWYDSNRADDDKMPASLVAQISNGVSLVLLLVFIAEPVWNLVPWSLTPLYSSVGKIRFILGTMICHVGLIFWPIGAVLFANLIRQKRWTGMFHSTALIAFLWWQALSATRSVLWTWTHTHEWWSRF